MIACATGEVCRVGFCLQLGLVGTAHAFGSLLSIFLKDTLLGEVLLHLLTSDVYGGHNDVARREVHELENALAEVGLYNVDAVADEVLVKMTFFCEHRLAFHNRLDAVLTHYLHHDVVIFIGILCPVYDGSVGCGVALELFQIVSQMGYGMFLYVACSIAQLFPLLELIGEDVALGTNTPECLVVACDLGGIAEEFLGCN